MYLFLIAILWKAKFVFLAILHFNSFFAEVIICILISSNLCLHFFRIEYFCATRDIFYFLGLGPQTATPFVTESNFNSVFGTTDCTGKCLLLF